MFTDSHMAISTMEAARLLSTTPNVISNTIRAGRLPAMRVGRQWRIPMTAIEERLNTRQRASRGR